MMCQSNRARQGAWQGAFHVPHQFFKKCKKKNPPKTPGKLGAPKTWSSRAPQSPPNDCLKKGNTEKRVEPVPSLGGLSPR